MEWSTIKLKNVQFTRYAIYFMRDVRVIVCIISFINFNFQKTMVVYIFTQTAGVITYTEWCHYLYCKFSSKKHSYVSSSFGVTKIEMVNVQRSQVKRYVARFSLQSILKFLTCIIKPLDKLGFQLTSHLHFARNTFAQIQIS